VNNNSIAQSIRKVILAKLGITQPPYIVKVTEDVGSVTVQIFDSREPGGAYREGKYVAGHIMDGWHDTLLEQKTTEAVEAMRPAFAGTEPK
jgi:hypothetical protein